MKTLKGFTKIQSRNKIFGLEFLDLLILLMVYLVVFMFSKNLPLNLALVFGAYLVLRFYKKGKPPHWAGSVVRFLLRPKRYAVRMERKEEIFK